MPSTSGESHSFSQRLLNVVERAGNALPNPVTLFILLAGLIVLLSAWLSAAGVQVVHPGTGKVVQVVNLLTVEGLHRMITGALPNFINFAPLGLVLVCLIGLAVAEHSGLIGAVLRVIVLTTPARFLTAVVVFCGTLSHTGSDVGYVLLIPLSAALFHTVGRHPLAGLAAAFAGVSGGFAANVLLSTSDVLLSAMTQEAARLLQPTYTVTPMSNYYFLAVSVILIVAVGTWITERVVEPRLGAYDGSVKKEPMVPLTPREKRGLWSAAAAALVLTGIVIAGLVPENGFLRDPANPGVLQSYFIKAFVFFIFLYGLVVGLTYGVVAGTIRSDHDVINGMTKAMQSIGGYVVLAFFVAQFVSYFGWTNLAVVLAVEGAEVLRHLDLGAIPLMGAFVVLAAVIDLALGSASAKWAVMAPIFVPMFMLLGYSPEMAQAAYRIGDSTMNVVTPLMSYFPLILTFVQRYEPRAGIGTLVAMMLPYSIVFLIGWTLMLVVWILGDIPLGPNAPLYLPTPVPAPAP
ncbi:MAG: AbgT family transporter [Opitutaceae bacterium]